MFQSYFRDFSAIEAKFEAQKIAFSPLCFYAVNAMISFGFLKLVDSFGEKGISLDEITKKSSLTKYGVNLLSEIGLGMGILKLVDESDFRVKLGKIGWFLLYDELTRVNFNFTRDICYEGAKELEKSLQSQKPEGLKHFSKEWSSIYEGLSQLPEQAKKSWFEFDHYYSDCVFPFALPFIFDNKPKLIYDIGGNTAKFAISACKFDPNVKLCILDLPSQTQLALKNIQNAKFQERISTIDIDILSPNSRLQGEPDVVLMSQFLDCFSLEQITFIMKKIHQIAKPNTQIFVIEPLWDVQKYEAAAFSLQATSLYFTTMANGKSKIYSLKELESAVCEGGFRLFKAHHNLGVHCYSLLEFRLDK